MRQRSTNVAEQLRTLPEANLGRLKELWSEHFGNPPHFRAQRELLVVMLAYRLQEKAHGGLSKSARRRLVGLAEATTGPRSAQKPASPGPKPGTRLIREWHGETHVISVLDDGAEYRGKRYRSLSEIARKITGTRWSGPAFFGLKSASGRNDAGKSA